MKSRQLLSVVLSLIMVFGVSAGSAFAQTDDVIDSFDDCVEAGYPVMESYPEQCMTDDGTVFVNDEDVDDYDDRYAKGDKFYVCHNKNTLSIDQSAVREHLAHGDSMKKCPDAVRGSDRDYDDKMHDKYSNKGPGNLRDHFAMYCDMTTEEREEKMQMHDDLPEDLRADMARYCEMNDDEQDSFRDSMMDKMDMMYDYMKDKMHTDKDMRDSLEKYCDMSESDRAAYITEHDKDAEKAAKMDRYCTLDEDGKTDFIVVHLDEYKAYMKDKMTDKKHMDYDRLCSMAASDRASEITDVAKLDKITEWCNMTPEEREEYKMKHRDGKDKMTDKKHMDYDRMCDISETDRALKIDDPEKLDRISEWCAMSTDERKDYKMKHPDVMKDKMDRMSDVAKDKKHDKMKFSDESKRLKAMIMTKYDVSDERTDEIKMKYREKHGEMTDEKKSDLKMKYKKHMSSVKSNMSDERRSMIHDRIAEMKAFKADLRDRASSMTDEEKQELRADFIERAKDMQLAWISPRTQMTAGVDAAEVECREGFSLVMKASNGVAMCLKADSALKMIDRGIVVPTN